MGAKSDDSSLFVYGALLRDVQVRQLLGRDVASMPARLAGYERGHARYFFLRVRQGATSQGRLLHGLSQSDFAILDKFEGVPRLYTRERIEVTGASGALVNCWVYLPTGWERVESAR